VAAGSAQEFTAALADIVGADTASREVQQALDDLGMSDGENRPAELRRLRERIERNLSGLIGPQMAHMIINRRLVLDERSRTALADSMRYVEERLEDSRSRLQGLSAALDSLRRYHRQILIDLPLGVCATGPDHRVLIWNLAMERMTGLKGSEATARPLQGLRAPWGDILAGFARVEDRYIHHMEVRLGGRAHWYNLHKAATLDPDLSPDEPASRTGLVMLLEDLTSLENLEAELAHSDRLASIGRLAAGVAHEIGNPVTGIASLTQNLREETGNAAVRETCDEVLKQTRRISGILQSLMGFSHSGAVSRAPEEMALRPVIEEAVGLVRLTHGGKQVTCELSCPQQLRVCGDRQRLSQVLVNLFTNACDASRAGDRVEVIARAEGDRTLIEILDQGEGIPEELREVVFEPFFTTKAPGEGTGLGLAMAHRIIQEHHGSIEIDSRPGAGTRVVISLPRLGGPPVHEPDPYH
jgi:signal transduction histidine kinase